MVPARWGGLSEGQVELHHPHHQHLLVLSFVCFASSIACPKVYPLGSP